MSAHDTAQHPRGSAQVARERPDPHEGQGRLPVPFVAFFASMAVVAGVYLVRHGGSDLGLGGDRRGPQRAVAAEPTPESSFQKTCAGCHQSNGRGVAGAFPPLAGSPWVTGDRETPIRVVLLGLAGPIAVDGATYAGAMPAFRDVLSDREIALAVTHARGSFGNAASPISAEDVAKVRASLEGRSEPWAGGAALEEARKTRVLP
jgi:mono/diheme cytochrome c family protein